MNKEEGEENEEERAEEEAGAEEEHFHTGVAAQRLGLDFTLARNARLLRVSQAQMENSVPFETFFFLLKLMC